MLRQFCPFLGGGDIFILFWLLFHFVLYQQDNPYEKFLEKMLKKLIDSSNMILICHAKPVSNFRLREIRSSLRLLGMRLSLVNNKRTMWVDWPLYIVLWWGAFLCPPLLIETLASPFFLDFVRPKSNSGDFSVLWRLDTFLDCFYDRGD